MSCFCDSHIHLPLCPAVARAHSDIAAAAGAGISYLIQPGVQAGDWQALLELAADQRQLYVAPGLHPLYADQWDDGLALRLREVAQHPKVVAIGEIGLDAAASVAPVLQEKVLRAQLQIALDEDLPVVLHSRHQNGALLAILRELQVGQRVGGVWHGFSAGLPFARQVVAEGFCVGIGPILLRDNVRKLMEAVTGLPATALLLETDYPDMTAQPTDLLKVAQRVAELRGLSLAQTAQVTTANARRLFAKLQDN